MMVEQFPWCSGNFMKEEQNATGFDFVNVCLYKKFTHTWCVVDSVRRWVGGRMLT